jgi:hypothetical protein
VLTVEAGAARDGKRGNNAVAGFEFSDGGADAADFAGKFVAHDELGAGRLVAAEDVEFTVGTISFCFYLKLS